MLEEFCILNYYVKHKYIWKIITCIRITINNIRSLIFILFSKYYDKDIFEIVEYIINITRLNDL